MKQNGKSGKAVSVISTILVALIVISAVFLMGSRICGYRVFNVISGSMEPTYSVGDLIYVKDVEPEKIEVGDPITFVLNENLVVATHRVVDVDPTAREFTTKGDANETVDSAPVHFNNVIGVPQFAIPYLGYVSAFIQNPPGMYLAIAFCVVLVILVFLPDMLDKRSRRQEQAEHSAQITNE